MALPDTGDWGKGMLQSRREFLIISDYGEKFGLREVSFKIYEKAGFQLEIMQPFRLAVAAEYCYGSVAIEISRKYLDSGPLDEEFTSLTAAEHLGENNKNTKLLTLAAGAMTLGCTIRPDIMKALKKLVQVKTSPAFRTQEARLQMQKAVLSYGHGTPYDFGNMSMNEATVRKMFPCAAMIMTEVGVTKHLKMMSTSGKVMSHIIGPPGDDEAGVTPIHPYDVCASCGADKLKANGSERLLICGKCKVRRYCSKGCQRKHHAVQKPICSRCKDEMDKFLDCIPLNFAGDAHPDYDAMMAKQQDNDEEEAPLLVSGNALGGLGSKA